MTIHIKRVYEAPADTDGARILVDRLWPRGLSKANARIDHWAKAISPSTELRRWYGHDPAKWPEFKARYFAELEDAAEGVEELLGYVRSGEVTFLFSSKELELNNAWALKEYVEQLR